ncbi:hypothetical protein [Pantoea sp. A4]|uniref:hypothetical protein n=1 Tax=Pantoea sp. A4 TaxID=1225184 RepID=UPI00036017AA|nr:hypothetical protein [Pantoea sp. A4]
MKIIILLIALISFGASASTTYTKEQLNDMDAADQLPEQEPPVTKGVEQVDFTTCKSDANNVLNKVADYYPAKEVVNTSALYVVKMWANDGVITVTCSEPDSKKIITQSSYR